MKTDFNTALELVKNKIKECDNSKPFVVVIDGMAASGKTTFANMLGTAVVHTDDFYRPRNSNGALSLSQYSGNFDIERFKSQVVCNLINGKDFEYGVFDCKEQRISETVKVKCQGAIIVEGAYSLHSDLGEYADLKLFFEISGEEQIARIIKRNGTDAQKSFSEIWIPAEQRYFEYYSIKDKADITVII